MVLVFTPAYHRIGKDNRYGCQCPRRGSQPLRLTYSRMAKSARAYQSEPVRRRETLQVPNLDTAWALERACWIQIHNSMLLTSPCAWTRARRTSTARRYLQRASYCRGAPEMDSAERWIVSGAQDMWMLAPHLTLPYATHLIHICERVGPPPTSKDACTIGAHRHRGQTYTTLRPLHSTSPSSP